jgi:hypothetical protein
MAIHYWLRGCAVLFLCRLGANAADHTATIVTFDVPGAGTGTNQGTYPRGINPMGAITGYYVDGNSIAHGFVRSPGGAITTFDAPDAGGGVNQGTTAGSINPAGAIAGCYFDGQGKSHGFVRSVEGAIAEFDVPGTTHGTIAMSINAEGAVTGYWSGAVVRGFVRSPAGRITIFNGLGAVQTFGWSINDSGTVAGYYVDTNNISHGLLRTASGEMTTFDAPGAGKQSTFNPNINNSGTVAGVYWRSDGTQRGYLRTASGVITTVDFPGSGWTEPSSINTAGTMAGSYGLTTQTNGYLRFPNNASVGFQAQTDFAFTEATAINSSDVVTGIYFNSASAFHGFVRMP